jgi:hypothetical protein
VDEIIGFAILLIIASMLERFFKAQKAKTQQQQQQPPEAEWEASGEEADDVGRQPASLQEMIAEELGLNLERLPKIEQEPEPPPARPGSGPQPARPGSGPQPARPGSGPQRARPGAGPQPARPGATGPPVRRSEAAPAPKVERVVYYPTPPEPEREREVTLAAERGALEAEARRGSVPARTRAAPIRRRPLREERAEIERRHPDSLERPRRPEDHDRFHERYAVPEPVSSHAEFHDRYMKPTRRTAAKRPKGPLPDHPEWSPEQKAIIWAEILGRPKGLE